MKTWIVFFSFAISSFFPAFIKAGDYWKIYPFDDGKVNLGYISAVAPLLDGGALASKPNKIYIIKDDNIDSIINPTLNQDYFVIHRMLTDSKGTVWISTLGGLAKYTKEGGFQKVSKIDYGGTLDYAALNGLTIDNNDNVWFFSNTQYVTKFDGAKFTDYDLTKLEYAYFNSNRLAVKDSLFYYDCPIGLVEVNFRSEDSILHNTIPLSEAKFTGNDLRYMVFDKAGNLYASSDANELSIRIKGKWKSINIPDTLKTHPDDYENKYILRITPVSDGKIYVFWATHTFFCKYDIATDTWEKINFPGNNINADHPVWVSSAAFDPDGYLWIGTPTHGIFRYKPDVQSVEENHHLLDAWIDHVYPNPTRGNILKARVFLLPDGVDNVEAYVSDIFGNKLIDFSNNFTIDPSTGEANLECSLEGLVNGAYIFVLKKGPSVRAKNFVKID